MEQAALRIMEAIGVQVLVIDEVHNILAGSYREQRIVLNTFSASSAIVCQISLVCFGVSRRGRPSVVTSSLRAGSSSSP